MENKNIVIILIAIIVILAAVLGMLVLHPFDSGSDINSKEPGNVTIKIKTPKTIYEGEDLTIKLTDSNNEPLSGKDVDIIIYDSTGRSILEDSIKTNSKGKAKLDLDLEKGAYIVNASFAGDENYSAGQTYKHINVIEEEVVEEPVIQQSTQSSGSSSGLHYDEEINVYYDDSGIVVDPDGQHGMEVGRPYSELRDARDRWERGEPVMV